MSTTTINTAHVRARRRREARYGWMFFAPFAIFFVLVFLVPIVVSVRSSFFRAVPSGGGLYGGGEMVDTFVGLENYAVVLAGGGFWTGLVRVMLFGAFQIPLMIGMALVLALLLDSLMVRRGVSFFRLAFFLPYAIPGVVAALVWVYLYNPAFSPFTAGLQWLSDGVNALLGTSVDLTIDFYHPNILLASMANMTTWTFTGYNMLIFLAALQTIPGDLYEAARMDGAGGWRIVRSIKIPLVSGAALLTVLLSIIGTIQLFNEPTIMQTVNSWMGNDYTPMMMAYNTMMGGLSPSGGGPASAVSILMAIVAASLAAVYALVQRKVV